MPAGQKKVFATPLTAVESTDKEGVGTIRIEGNKIYKWVKLLNSTATVAGVAGDLVAYAKNGYDQHTVVTDFTDADTAPVGAGLLVASVNGTAGTAEYCWIQIAGPAVANQALGGSPGEGAPLMAGTTDKTLTLATANTTSGALNGLPIAAAVDVAGKKVALNCPF